MTTEGYIAAAGVLATLLGILVTWVVMRRSLSRKRLSYRIRVDRLLQQQDAELGRDLKITYQNEELPDPALVALDVTNVGNVAVEGAVITVNAPGPTYLIPAYFDQIPPGYEDLWTGERTDAEECKVSFAHINPGQTARVRFLMDETPQREPMASCAMPNVEFVRSSRIELSSFSEVVLDIVAPGTAAVLRSIR